MQFKEIYGNDELKEKLVNMVKNNKLGHALLFCENEGTGALAFAVALSQYINCTHGDGAGGGLFGFEPTALADDSDSCGECPSCKKHQKLIHPDMHFAFPVNSSSSLTEQEKKRPVSDMYLKQWRALFLQNPYFIEQELYAAIGIDNKAGIISVNEGKAIIEKLSLKPYEADYKTMIIYLPEKMNEEAANRLLKLIEEPPTGTIFLLVSKEPGKLLPTILSRCQIIRLSPIDSNLIAGLLEDNGVSQGEDAKMIANIAAGSYGKALKIAAEHEDENEFASLLDKIFDAAIRKSLPDMIPLAESTAELGKEKQKEFCLTGENYIRKIAMFARGVSSISYTTQSEHEHFASLAKSVKDDFYEKGFNAFEGALRAVESNVNSKLIFSDLCNRLLIYI
ncbi:MAG: hypothetical protein HUJ92_01145 [Bacteroidales bacterium]|nr:hypothetical protein [Bacteroidales bacterium]